MMVRSKSGYSMAMAVVFGFVAAIIVSFLLTLGLTSLVLNGSLEENVADLAVFFIRALSVFLGCLIAGGMYKERAVPVIGSVAGSYLVAILTVGIIAFDGFVQGFVSGLLSVLVGSVLTLVLRIIPKKRAFHNVRHIN